MIDKLAILSRLAVIFTTLHSADSDVQKGVKGWRLEDSGVLGGLGQVSPGLHGTGGHKLWSLCRAGRRCTRGTPGTPSSAAETASAGALDVAGDGDRAQLHVLTLTRSFTSSRGCTAHHAVAGKMPKSTNVTVGVGRVYGVLTFTRNSA